MCQHQILIEFRSDFDPYLSLDVVRRFEVNSYLYLDLVGNFSVFFFIVVVVVGTSMFLSEVSLVEISFEFIANLVRTLVFRKWYNSSRLVFLMTDLFYIVCLQLEF